MILKFTERKPNKGNRNRARAGFSITEMVAATLILAMLAMVLAAGIPAINNVYRSMVVKNESLTIVSYAARLISDELRHAKNIVPTGSNVQYSSRTYGVNAMLTTTDGFLAVEAGGETYEFLNQAAYTKGPAYTEGLALNLDNISYDSSKKTFTINFIVYNKSTLEPGDPPSSTAIQTITMKVRQLNS